MRIKLPSGILIIIPKKVITNDVEDWIKIIRKVFRIEKRAKELLKTNRRRE
jgi:hypothetical protein